MPAYRFRAQAAFFLSVCLFSILTMFSGTGAADTAVVDYDAPRIGRMIFNDPRFSASGNRSCSSCHQPAFAFSDNQGFSIGSDGEPAAEHTPPLFDLERKLAFFNRDPVFTLNAAVQRCLEQHQGLSVMQAYARLKKDHTLSQFSLERYGRVSAGALFETLSQYLLSLKTAESRYEQFLKGHSGALTLAEQKGRVLFEKKGCHYCHTGRQLGGTVLAPAVAGDRAEDVQVPRLKNLGQTAPYFSDGSAQTLAEAIRIMGRDYTRMPMDDEEVALIRLFLLSNDSSIYDFEGPVLYETIR